MPNLPICHLKFKEKTLYKNASTQTGHHLSFLCTILYKYHANEVGV